jgi:hypothetical protein
MLTVTIAALIASGYGVSGGPATCSGYAPASSVTAL